MEEQPQSKRQRRPSVRLGEIGLLGSELWLEALPRQHWRRSAAAGKKKAPRIRSLEKVGDKAEEEWSADEPAVVASADEEKVVVKKRRSGLNARKAAVVENRVDEAKEEVSLPLQVIGETPSSDYEGSGSKAKDDSDRSEQGVNPNSPCYSDGTVAKQQRCIIIIPANPHSNGEEMQGAIEDGPGKGSSTVVKQRRVVASRSNPSRDTDVKPPLVTPRFSERTVAFLSAAGVDGWLQDLGLGKYSQLFHLNEVDIQVLPLLTMDDLREMGVDAVGARRKMFTHIQQLGHLCPL